MKIVIDPGMLLYEALEAASARADECGESVTFDFNELEHQVDPWEGEASWRARARERTGRPVPTRDELAEQARASLEKRQADADRAIQQAGVPTEAELRDMPVPWPASEEELVAYIRGLVDRPHDYGTCVYAMSMAAVAAYYYVSKRLGVSGFQASCADMDFIRRTRSMEHGFQIVDYANALYPQYWDDERRPIFEALMRNPVARERIRVAAQKKLEDQGDSASPKVLAHWRVLAAPVQPEENEG